MADTNITPPVGSLSAVGYAARVITIGLVLTGYAPSVLGVPNTSITPPGGSLSTQRETFPTTSVLDSFTRADENPVANGTWGQLRLADDPLRLVSNALHPPASSSGGSYWSASTFGPDCELYCTVPTFAGVADNIDLMARVTGAGIGTISGYAANFERRASGLRVALVRYDNNTITLLTSLIDVAGWVPGDSVGLSVRGTTLSLWTTSGATWRVIVTATDSTYTSANRVAVKLSAFGGALVCDDVGGGTLVPANDAPTLAQTAHVASTPAPATLQLSGTAPTVLSSGNTTLTPTTGTLVLGLIDDPNVSVSPPAGSLTLTSFVPIVRRSQDPLAGALDLTGYVPGVQSTVVQGTILTPPAAALTFTGAVPLVNRGIIPPAGIMKCQSFATQGWNANTEPDLAGYKVYRGIVTLTYTTSVDVGNVLSYVWNDLPYGNNYFAVTAYDTAVPPNESGFSAEVSTFISGSGFAPLVTVNTPSGVSLTPPAGSLNLTGTVSTVLQNNLLTTGLGSLTLTGQIPSLGMSWQVPVGSLALTGYASTLSISSPTGIVVTPPTGSLIFTGYAFDNIPGTGRLTMTGYAPTAIEKGSFNIVPPAGSLVLFSPVPFNTAFAREANAVIDAGGSPTDA